MKSRILLALVAAAALSVFAIPAAAADVNLGATLGATGGPLHGYADYSVTGAARTLDVDLAGLTGAGKVAFFIDGKLVGIAKPTASGTVELLIKVFAPNVQVGSVMLVTQQVGRSAGQPPAPTPIRDWQFLTRGVFVAR